MLLMYKSSWVRSDHRIYTKKFNMKSFSKIDQYNKRSIRLDKINDKKTTYPCPINSDF